jgi:chemotaxis signal transduction protein
VPCTPHQTPASLAADDSRPADTIDHVHTCATGVTDLRDRVVWLMKWRNWQGLYRRRESQGKDNTAINLIICFRLL